MEVDSITKQIMGGRAKMIPSCGAEVMLVPLIESESTEGEKKTMFQDE